MFLISIVLFVINAPSVCKSPPFWNQIDDKMTENHSKWVQKVSLLVMVYFKFRLSVMCLLKFFI